MLLPNSSFSERCDTTKSSTSHIHILELGITLCFLLLEAKTTLAFKVYWNYIANYQNKISENKVL